MFYKHFYLFALALVEESTTVQSILEHLSSIEQVQGMEDICENPQTMQE